MIMGKKQSAVINFNVGDKVPYIDGNMEFGYGRITTIFRLDTDDPELSCYHIDNAHIVTGWQIEQGLSLKPHYSPAGSQWPLLDLIMGTFAVTVLTASIVAGVVFHLF